MEPEVFDAALGLMSCVAMGCPDDSFPANAVRSDRESDGDFVHFVGFAD